MIKAYLILTLNVLIFTPIQSGFQTVTVKNVQISWANRGSQTEFSVVSSLDGKLSLTSAWIGIGINTNTRMGGCNVIWCKSLGSNSAVEHYYNYGYSPDYIDSNLPQIGLSNTALVVDQGKIVCNFTRDNTNQNGDYYEINEKSQYYYVIGYGKGEFSNHGRNKGSTGVVNFPLTKTTSSTTAPTTASVTPKSTSSILSTKKTSKKTTRKNTKKNKSTKSSASSETDATNPPDLSKVEQMYGDKTVNGYVKDIVGDFFSWLGDFTNKKESKS